MNFKIGQEVVCIKSHSQGAVKEGEIYTIEDLNLCPKCKELDLHVGIYNTSFLVECTCGHLDDTVISWLHHSLFKPLDELYNEELNEELNEIFSKQPFEI